MNRNKIWKAVLTVLLFPIFFLWYLMVFAGYVSEWLEPEVKKYLEDRCDIPADLFAKLKEERDQPLFYWVFLELYDLLYYLSEMVEYFEIKE